MPRKTTMQIAVTAIKKDFGDLDDIPHELANTIANIYYRYFNQVVENALNSENQGSFVPKQVKREGDLTNGMVSWAKSVAKINADYESVPGFIEGLRKINKNAKPDLYEMTVEYILDCLKYDIHNAHKKIGLRKMIERKAKKGKVQEIPNLIDLFDI